jgi:hypothetical protein
MTTRAHPSGTCQRFSAFLRERSQGRHLFRGNLFDCFHDGLADTQGRKVMATEISCHNGMNDITNLVVIDGATDTANPGTFDLDERCF